MHTSYAYIYDKQKKRYHIQSNLFIKTKSSIIRMEEILVFTPLVFILIYLFIKKGFEYEINLPNRFVRFFLLAEKIIAIGLLVLIIGLYFQIRIFGFEGNKTYFYFAYFSLLLTRPIVERSNLSEIEKKLSKLLTGIPVACSVIAMIPWLGLIIWSFFIRVTGSEREIEFENENYRIEKIEYVVMSGGHYNYYLIEKMGNSPIELIKKEYYWHPDRVYNFIDIFKMDGSLYFSKKDKSGEADTIRISPY